MVTSISQLSMGKVVWCVGKSQVILLLQNCRNCDLRLNSWSSELLYVACAISLNIRKFGICGMYKYTDTLDCMYYGRELDASVYTFWLIPNQNLFLNSQYHHHFFGGVIFIRNHPYLALTNDVNNSKCRQEIQIVAVNIFILLVIVFFFSIIFPWNQ